MTDEIEALLNAPYDTSDPEHVAKARRNAARIAKEDEVFFKERVMGTREGRGWLWRRLVLCHIYDSCIGADPYGTYFLLGERNVGNALIQEAQRYPAEYQMMVQEQKGKG